MPKKKREKKIRTMAEEKRCGIENPNVFACFPFDFFVGKMVSK